jgi:hypothetical protein
MIYFGTISGVEDDPPPYRVRAAKIRERGVSTDIKDEHNCEPKWTTNTLSSLGYAY